jgi:hypothetical protein
LLLVLLQRLVLLETSLLQREVREVYEVRDVLALVRAPQQVPFLRALHVNR